MNSNDAQLRINHVLRSNEQLLAFEQAVAMPYDDPSMRLITGSSPRPIWVAITPARLIELRSNGHLTSAPWGHMASLGIHKAGRKWQYQWQHITQTMPYAPVQVSEQFGQVLQRVQSGAIPLMALPDESTTYTVLDEPHGDSALGRTATAMSIPEKRCVCDACGATVGIEAPYGAECPTCHRTIDTKRP